MNLRVLVNPKEAEGHPFEFFLIGCVYAVVSVALAAWLFPGFADIVAVTITVAAATPVVYTIISFEARKDAFLVRERDLMREHKRAVFVFLLLFLGFTAGFLITFLLAPGLTAFSSQIETISAVSAGVTGSAVFRSDAVWIIFLNNMRVLGICALLSLAFGTGGLLILSWNASVLGTAIGSLIKDKLSLGGSVLHAVGAGAAVYLVHGIPEILAYLLGGLAGGILFHAFVRKVWNRYLAFDVFVLGISSTLLLLVSAWIEVHPVVIR